MRHTELFALVVQSGLGSVLTSRFDADVDSTEPASAWRAAEATEHLPVGAEISLKGDELLHGSRGIAFAPSGASFHIEHVSDVNLDSFLARRTPEIDHEWHLRRDAMDPEDYPEEKDICKHGRFLLNDPRVGLLNNQRISYETALMVARALRRTLVLPGFFKFPHPDAFDGTQWVPVSRLFNMSHLENCNSDVIELEELINRCGPDVLDMHVTIPFAGEATLNSKEKSPWFNATRPHLRWQPMSGDALIELRSQLTVPLMPLKLTEAMWRLLRPFLRAEAAQAQTVRAHGLIAKNYTFGRDQVCFVPNEEVQQQSARLFAQARHTSEANAENFKLLAFHLRRFKRSPETSGGFLPTDYADMTDYFCNFRPFEFQVMVSYFLKKRHEGFTPTHTFLATNEADHSLISEYILGYPGVRLNPFTPDLHDAAVTAEDCFLALRSILVDTWTCVTADLFFGNTCSTMSQYIYQLRILMFGSTAFDTSGLLGGTRTAEVLRDARDVAIEFQKQYGVTPALSDVSLPW